MADLAFDGGDLQADQRYGAEGSMRAAMRKLVGAVGAGLMLALVTGCAESDTTGPSGSEDLASYGCAVVADLDGGEPVESWTMSGEMDADGEYANAIVAVGVLGGLSGTQLSGYENLDRPTAEMTIGLQQQDAETIQAGLDKLAAACAEADPPSSDADTSIEGRITLACTLDSEIHDAEFFTEDRTQGDATMSDSERLLLTKASAVGALLGGAVPTLLDGHPEFFEAAGSLLFGLGQRDANRTVDALETIHTLCETQ